jgi:hypothetical protein
VYVMNGGRAGDPQYALRVNAAAELLAAEFRVLRLHGLWRNGSRCRHGREAGMSKRLLADRSTCLRSGRCSR